MKAIAGAYLDDQPNDRGEVLRTTSAYPCALLGCRRSKKSCEDHDRFVQVLDSPARESMPKEGARHENDAQCPLFSRELVGKLK